MTKTTFLRKLLRSFISSVAFAHIILLTLISSPVYADDTDVFLGSSSSLSNTARPNILFVLDTSGSMNWTDGVGVPGLTRLDAMKDALVQILETVSNVNVGLATFNTRGGPIRYPVSFVDADVSDIEGDGFNIAVPVAEPSDDAEENINAGLGNNGVMDLSHTQLHLSAKPDPSSVTALTYAVTAMTDDGFEDVSSGTVTNDWYSFYMNETREGGMLFRGINVPNNASIISARLVFTVDTDGNNTTDNLGNDETSYFQATITAEAADSAANFTIANSNYSNRVRTSSAPTVTLASGSNGDLIPTPNIASVIQEVVSRPGWVAGNNMALFLAPTQGFRDFSSYRRNPNESARLVIEYAVSPDSFDEIVGLRFQDVRIPQGATIERAHFDFYAANNSSAKMSYNVMGELTPSSITFANTNNNISSRAVTTAKESWELSDSAADEWTAGERYQSADFAAVIQEIVNQPGWCGGNSLTLILTPEYSSNRSIMASEGATNSADDAPTLRVDFDTDTSNISPPNTGCTATNVTARVSQSNDDVEEYGNNDLSSRSSDLELITDTNLRSNRRNQKIGLRFNDINLVQGANVLNAYIEFTADETSTTTTNLTFRGHNVDNSPSYSGDSAVSNRLNNATSASVDWNNIPAWNTVGETHRSPNIAPIIQEIINRPGWVANNSISIMITGSGTRVAESYDGSAAAAPRLVVETQTNLAGVPSQSAQTVRQRLIQEIQDMRAGGGTPLVDAYMEGVRYYRGMSVDWGLQRGAQESNDRYSRVSHTASFTGGTVKRPSGCTDMNLDSSYCIQEKILGGPIYKAPITDACSTNHIVILSDGEQNTFVGRDIATLLAEGKAQDPSFPDTCSSASGGADCGRKLAEFANTFDQFSGLPGDQTITTHSIGFTFTTQFFQDLAARGGGQYKTANSAAELVTAFEEIFSEILSRPTTFVAPTLTINAFNQLYNSNEIYLSLFEPEKSTRWSGNIKKYRLCTPAEGAAGTCITGAIMDQDGNYATENGQIMNSARSFWTGSDDGSEVELGGAGDKAPTHANRKLYTYTGNVAPENVSLVSPQNLLSVGNASLTEDMLSVSAAERDDLIRWIRGQDVDDENSNGSDTDDRWVYGDPLHSSAITINYGGDATTPIVKLVVGTNDGSIRLINANNGIEEWAFFPQDMLGIQSDLRNDFGGNHIYGVDGSPRSWVYDKDHDGIIEPGQGDFVRVYIGQRRGGSNYYALDLTPDTVATNPDSISDIKPKLMWQIEGGQGDFAQLGQTWSRPFVTSIKTLEAGNIVKRDVLIFAGGYDPSNDINYGPATIGNAIYIVDALTGKRIWWASSDSSASLVVPDMQYAIPSDMRLMDMDGDGTTDRLIVGDLGGQIWRVDLGSKLAVNSNGGTVIGKLAELSNNIDPTAIADQRRFMYQAQVAYVKDLGYAEEGPFVAVAINSGNRADPLNVKVRDKAFVLRDFLIGGMTDSGSGLADSSYETIKMGDLYNASADITNTGDLDALKASSGWYIDLEDEPGEKSISRGRIIIPTDPNLPPYYIFNTYAPASSSAGSACSVSLGQNLTYNVNLLNSNGTIVTDINSPPSRTKENRAFGISSEPTIIRQEGQGDEITIFNEPMPDRDDVENMYIGNPYVSMSRAE